MLAHAAPTIGWIITGDQELLSNCLIVVTAQLLVFVLRILLLCQLLLMTVNRAFQRDNFRRQVLLKLFLFLL